VNPAKGAKPPQRADAAAFQRARDPGTSPFSLPPLPTQWIYDGQHFCGRVELTDDLFVAFDADERVIGKFKMLRQATRALPARGAP
jgi:hypothetical protein